eukprot:TRINITY_DN711_c0_g1_i2.p1 TRINITY_DN711_c0_g1~~TRINITY_DN711_c0_g1_i2.p1  ORF type:complete len:154 (+),score=9.99 TRINITY_DN711_c0_g1_i2:349-810(+)
MKEWLKYSADEISEYLSLSDSMNKLRLSHPPTHLLTKPEDKVQLNSWIKIELVCVASNHQGEKLGSILLAAALVFSYVLDKKKHSLLQVAGGEENQSAIHLYTKFQFERAQDFFNKPNQNIMVLWNIRNALESLRAEEFLLEPLKNRKELNHS